MNDTKSGNAINQEVKWNDLSEPCQPKGAAGLAGKVVSSPKSVTIPGDSIMPGTPDPQAIPSGTQGNS